MTTSQFRIFRSSDIGSPSLYGTTGSLVQVLDYCLITGSGWIKPFPNTSSVTSFNALASSLAAYQQPTGSSGSGSSGMTLFINDGAPNVTSLYREAWATGWEICTGSNYISTTVGGGTGQFPLPGQSLTQGKVVIRKSATSDATSQRPWIVAADSSSFYLFVATGDIANTYFGFGFGDFFSFKSGSSDLFRCIIMGRSTENSTAGTSEGLELFSAVTAGTAGCFIPRSFTGFGTSITASKHGDAVKGSATAMFGNIPYPNGPDTSFYCSPIWVCEGGNVRGQIRGLYQTLHAVANFQDGTVFTGSSDFNGKTFLMLKATNNAGVYLLETSNTIQTN